MGRRVKPKQSVPGRSLRSDAVRHIALARRINRTPLVLTGVGAGRLVTIPPAEFKRLHVDDRRYQRGRVPYWVNELIHYA